MSVEAAEWEMNAHREREMVKCGEKRNKWQITMGIFSRFAKKFVLRALFLFLQQEFIA